MLSQDALQALQELLDPEQVIDDPVELIVYEIDAAQDSGCPDSVLLPRSSEEVARIVQWARQYRVTLVGRGAGTGLSGGAVADRGGVIVGFARMKRLIELDEAGRSAVVEPGLVNQDLDEAARVRGLYYPPDPASGRSATLGGNLAENAGGPHCFKYGVTTNYVTGLEFVNSEGRLTHIGGRALDYPEYDFASLLTGSEGTLALLTRIELRLLRKPPGVKTMMACFDSVEQAGQAVSAVIAAGLVPATLEMMDQKIARIVEDYAHPGIPVDAGALLIVEVDGYPASLDLQIDEIVQIITRNGGRDLRIAEDAAQRDKIWFARKSAAGAMARLAPAYLLLDGTVPRSRLSQALQASNAICSEKDLQVGYVFHAGDGNLHPFILMYPQDPEQVARAHQAGAAFMQAVVDLGGSITGEHGVGIEKRDFMPLMYTPAELEIMRDVRFVFDPDERLNPGKIFPRTEVQSARINTEELNGLPLEVFAPASTQEAARGLAALSRLRQPATITGASPAEIQAYPQNDTRISTGELTGIRAFAQDDLYISAGAGTRLAEIQAFLAAEQKQLPLVSPWEHTTLGGLLAANLNAPLRMRYGSLRDQVLAMTIVLADGRSIRAGRPVVKNVAGYDLPKLMVGSYGTLGLISEVTFKFTSLPRQRRSLLIPVDDLATGLAWGRLVLAQALVASAVVVCKGISLPAEARAYEKLEHLLVYTAEGHPADVEAELEQVRQALQAAGASRMIASEQVSGSLYWAELLRKDEGQSLKVRTGVPPRDLLAFLKTQASALNTGAYLIDLASGHIYTTNYPDGVGEAQSWLHELRKAALAAGGYTLVLDTPADWRGKLNPWGYKPDTLDLMRRLKARWDPSGIINPGIFGPELNTS
jgi:glycolate oxidase subunit GlcD